MKVAVVYLPGNNCEQESVRALQNNGIDAELLRWNQHEHIDSYAGYFIVGGWAYEDRIRAGIIGSKDTIIKKISGQVTTGKPILGVCNGCQVLVESGMIPGISEKVDMGLAPNKNPLMSGYYCDWVTIKSVQQPNRSVFTSHLDQNHLFDVPIAHGEGRFVCSDDTLNTLQKNNQIVFTYSDKQGNETPEYPTNPNGSVANIAGICNKEGNVLGMMPHPERACTLAQLPFTTSKASNKTWSAPTSANSIFTSFKEALQ